MTIEARINEVVVSPQELIEASEEISNLPEEHKNSEARSFLLVNKYKGNPNKAMAIDLRLNAMSKIIQSGQLPGWAKRINSNRSHWVSEPVWEAAAREPLIFSEKDAHFNIERFLNYVISNVEPEGDA